jgi:hypothetical protein
MAERLIHKASKGLLHLLFCRKKQIPKVWTYFSIVNLVKGTVA